MSGFDFVCPMNYPNQCNLDQPEMLNLEAKEGEKIGFLMYQFKGQEEYLIDTIKGYFNGNRGCRILDAQKEPGTGVNICKICRLTTASHFGIGVLSPENPNVYLEVGFLWGQGKPVLMIVNENNLQGKMLENLAFDVRPFMKIVYSSQKDLDEGLYREGPSFLERVLKYGRYHQELVKLIRNYLEEIKLLDSIELLKFMLLHSNGGKVRKSFIHLCYQMHMLDPSIKWNFFDTYISQYTLRGMINVTNKDDEACIYWFNPEWLPILRQEIYKVTCISV